jgi:hypothetical protein
MVIATLAKSKMIYTMAKANMFPRQNKDRTKGPILKVLPMGLEYLFNVMGPATRATSKMAKQMVTGFKNI